MLDSLDLSGCSESNYRNTDENGKIDRPSTKAVQPSQGVSALGGIAIRIVIDLIHKLFSYISLSLIQSHI